LAAEVRFALLALLFVGCSIVAAQGLFKYKDADGNWVYSDRRPDDAREVEQLPLADAASPPEVVITRRVVEGRVEVVANNQCFCPAEVGVRVINRDNVAGNFDEMTRAVAAARRETVILRAPISEPLQPVRFGYQYLAVLGDPEARHEATEPYRAPFALARSFRITQASPTRITHRDPASYHAVDIDMPVGTQIYAARAGTVIEVASQFFEGSADPSKARNANIIRILHPDGTMAVYAHLNWDSIRVKPGQVVRRGEYIADSGNTGFTTGPHLHFAVQRNAGLHLESVALTFTGPAGSTVQPQTGMKLTAY